MEVPASLPAGTSRMPVAFWPGAAVAVPTVKLCARSPAKQKTVIASVQRRLLSFIAKQYKLNSSKGLKENLLKQARIQGAGLPWFLNESRSVKGRLSSFLLIAVC